MRIALIACLLPLLAACAPVATVPSGPSPAAASGPYYGPGPYASHAERRGSNVHSAGTSHPVAPTQYNVIEFKSWSDAGYLGRVTAHNRLGVPFCVKLTWAPLPGNTQGSGSAMVLPPNATNHIIGYWITRYEVNFFPGYDVKQWDAPVVDRTVAVTDLDCIRSDPTR